jgi:hypothetical protein
MQFSIFSCEYFFFKEIMTHPNPHSSFEPSEKSFRDHLGMMVSSDVVRYAVDRFISGFLRMLEVLLNRSILLNGTTSMGALDNRRPRERIRNVLGVGVTARELGAMESTTSAVDDHENSM